MVKNIFKVFCFYQATQIPLVVGSVDSLPLSTTFSATPSHSYAAAMRVPRRKFD